MPPELLAASTDQMFQLLLGLVTLLFGFLLKVLWGRITKLSDDFSAYRESATEKFVGKDDQNRRHDEILERLKDIQNHIVRVEEKLDRKQDKP